MLFRYFMIHYFSPPDDWGDQCPHCRVIVITDSIKSTQHELHNMHIIVQILEKKKYLKTDFKLIKSDPNLHGKPKSLAP